MSPLRTWLVVLVVVLAGAFFATGGVADILGSNDASPNVQHCENYTEVTSPARGTRLELQERTTVTRRICPE